MPGLNLAVGGLLLQRKGCVEVDLDEITFACWANGHSDAVVDVFISGVSA